MESCAPVRGAPRSSVTVPAMDPVGPPPWANAGAHNKTRLETPSHQRTVVSIRGPSVQGVHVLRGGVLRGMWLRIAWWRSPVRREGGIKARAGTRATGTQAEEGDCVWRTLRGRARRRAR